MNVAAVVFDIGNVLIEWRPERHFDRVIGPARRDALFRGVDLHAMNDAIDRGADFRTTVEVWAARHPDWSAEIRLWHDAWLQLAGPAIPRSVASLRALRAAGIPVYALSNFGIGPFALAEPVYPVLSEFDRRYISGHMGVAKPDAAIYEAVEADCRLPPERLLFTDDRAENIAVAASRGWRTHVFDGPEGWVGRLADEGLLPRGVPE